MFMFGLMPSGTPAPQKLEVGGTNIFARGRGDRQVLAYGMNVAAQAPLAMVLPLPVPANSAEDSVRFVDLQAYPEFFVDLNECFPAVPVPQGRGGRGVVPLEREAALVVHEVGDFEASFVPTLADVDRLDPRFCVPSALWENLPQYADWGFAVFQLKNIATPPATGLKRWLGRSPSPSPKTVHPMALDFPRRHLDRVFFPTIHLHDDTVHAEDDYDHLLFWQADATQTSVLDPETSTGFGAIISEGRVGDTVDIARTADLIDGEEPLHRRRLKGRLPNRDHWLVG